MKTSGRVHRVHRHGSSLDFSWSSAVCVCSMDDCEAWLREVFNRGDPESTNCIIDALWATFEQATNDAQTAAAHNFAPVPEPVEVIMIPPEHVEVVDMRPVRCSLIHRMHIERALSLGLRRIAHPTPPSWNCLILVRSHLQG